MSRQRQVILEELHKLHSHPTADELYPIVRQIIPNISLATVYRNLNQLADSGMIRRLEYGGVQKRFDGYVEPHYHLRCKKCGRVYDLIVSNLAVVKQAMITSKKHRIDGYNLEFYGLCHSCLTKEKNNDRTK